VAAHAVFAFALPPSNRVAVLASSEKVATTTRSTPLLAVP
jgi:hypothetical protein